MPRRLTSSRLRRAEQRQERPAVIRRVAGRGEAGAALDGEDRPDGVAPGRRIPLESDLDVAGRRVPVIQRHVDPGAPGQPRGLARRDGHRADPDRMAACTRPRRTRPRRAAARCCPAGRTAPPGRARPAGSRRAAGRYWPERAGQQDRDPECGRGRPGDQPRRAGRLRCAHSGQGLTERRRRKIRLSARCGPARRPPRRRHQPPRHARRAAGRRRRRSARASRKSERQPGELGGEPVPAACPAEHGVIPIAHLDRRQLPDGAGTLRVGPGLLGIAGVVVAAVDEQNPAAGQLADRLARRQPGRQPGDRRHHRMPGHAQRRARPHRVAYQHDGYPPEVAGDPVEQLGQVMDRRRRLAVPAAEAEPRPVDQDLAAAQRAPDGPRHRHHPQHAELHRGGRFRADGPAPVRDHDDPRGAAEAADGAQQPLTAHQILPPALTGTDRKPVA